MKEEKSKEESMELLEDMLSSWGGKVDGDLLVSMEMECRKQQSSLDSRRIPRAWLPSGHTPLGSNHALHELSWEFQYHGSHEHFGVTL